MQRAFIGDIASQCFDLSSFRFTVHPFALSATGRLSRFSFWSSEDDAFYERLKTIKCIFFVLLLGPMLLGFDDDNAILRNAAIAKTKQTLFEERG
jgi:hypothetical protein